MHPSDDTIVAIASAPGGAARGIVRLSGPNVGEIVGVCFESGGDAGCHAEEQSVGCHAHACVGMPGNPPKKGATAGLSSSASEISQEENTAGQASSGTRKPRIHYQRATKGVFERNIKNHAHATPGTIRLSGIDSPLPCDLYLWPDGRSYTGQPVAEIHTIGSPPLLDAVVRVLCALGARLAEPGEFTLRAFLAGRIDLSQAEAVLGVIDAEDPARFRVALAQLAGGLAGPLGGLRDELVDLLAEIEAGLDFADEDLPPTDRDAIRARLHRAAETVDDLARRMTSRGETVPVVSAVLVGQPNAGKSSLFNALCGRDGAMVSALPGTTRDYLVAELDLDGVRCRLIDTAGIEPAEPPNSSPSPDDVDHTARDLAAEQGARCDVRIVCIDASRQDTSDVGPYDGPPANADIVAWTKVDLATPGATAGLSSNAHGAGALSQFDNRTGCHVHACVDMQENAINMPTQAWAWHPNIKVEQSTHHENTPGQAGSGTLPHGDSRNARSPQCVLRTSSATGEGIDALRAALRRGVLTLGAGDADVVAGTAVRCRESMRLAGESLARAGRLAAAGQGDELLAAELRVVLDRLGHVVGTVYTDDLLDRIFSRFCIGK